MTTLDAAGQQAARKELEVVLADPLFDGARRLSSVLRYLVEEVLAGRGDRLKEYTLGIAVLDRGSEFDPRLDSIVEWRRANFADASRPTIRTQGRTTALIAFLKTL